MNLRRTLTRLMVSILPLATRSLRDLPPVLSCLKLVLEEASSTGLVGVVVLDLLTQERLLLWCKVTQEHGMTIVKELFECFKD